VLQLPPEGWGEEAFQSVPFCHCLRLPYRFLRVTYGSGCEKNQRLCGPYGFTAPDPQAGGCARGLSSIILTLILILILILISILIGPIFPHASRLTHHGFTLRHQTAPNGSKRHQTAPLINFNKNHRKSLMTSDFLHLQLSTATYTYLHQKLQHSVP